MVFEVLVFATVKLLGLDFLAATLLGSGAPLLSWSSVIL
jgi:hypothetical protein